MHWTPRGLCGTVKELLLMSEPYRKKPSRAVGPPLASVRKGGVRKGCGRGGKVQAKVKTKALASPPTPVWREECQARKRTFPSETARRLMATMAMAMDNPRALLEKRSGSGSIGLVDMLPGDVARLLLDVDVEGKPGLPFSLGGVLAEDNGKVRDGSAPRARGSYVPSKRQMSCTFSKCLPKQDVENFEFF